MTKKHFIMMAEMIERIENPAEREEMAEKQAKLCAIANPRFDKVRFFAACNVALNK